MMPRSILACVFLFIACGAHADTLTLAPVADATLFQPSGGNPETADSQGPHLFVGRIAQGLRRRALLRFDLTALPAGAVIDDARLELTVSRTISGSVVVNLHRIVAPWREGSANSGTPGGQGTAPGSDDPTWSQRAFPATPWTSLGGDYAAAPSASVTLDGEIRYTVPATAAMQADLASWQNDDASNFGWALVSDESQTPPTAKRLESGEALDPATRPLLVIDYHQAPRVPVPALSGFAAVLLMLGMWAATRWTAARR